MVYLAKSLLRSLLSLCLNALIEGEVIICSRLVLLRAEKSDSIVVIHCVIHILLYYRR